MEFVEIKFIRSRSVFIDGEEDGLSNKILRVGRGTHVFDLGEPKDYRPAEVQIVVDGTNSIEPMVIEFEEHEA